ncbi:MAG: HDOD domain-containing protein [Desulfovibrio sp.]|nr:HDOD domain-containing protein [Desulfovibrio sp.]
MNASKIRNLIQLHTPEETSRQNTVIVARQPIFDLAGAIQAYELLFRDPSLKPGLGGKSAHAATSSVMVDGFELMRPSLRQGQRFFINFTREMLEAGLANLLPPEFCAIEILEDVQPTEDALRGLLQLKQQGYLLALDDYTGQEDLAPFVPLVDIVKVEVLGCSPDRLLALVNSLLPHKVSLLAEKVEDLKTADLCRQMRFSLFQGFFYSKAELVRGRKLTPSQITKSRILAYSSSDDMDRDIHKMVDAISADVYLSYKLLRYVNSAFFGLSVPVSSIRHAIAILGRVKLRQWLCVTALAEMDSAPMSRELVLLSALRAKFFELLGERVAPGGKLSHSLFLVGLFSLLESMLQVPMREILSTLSLEEDQKQVLAFHQGPLAPWLDLLDAYERGRWAEVRETAARLRLSEADLAPAYAEASTWSTSLFDGD